MIEYEILKIYFVMSIKKCSPAFVSVFALVAIIMVGGCSSAKSELSPQLKVMADEGRAYYQNKCKTTAGEKIYRSVVDVEGIFLIKIRPFISENQL
ncbi:hypothetical protein WH367_24355, partial [Comamonas sp. MYb21]|uniref:hypothetical protein n=1 Tax=Comamonas sp. MYb21 TaxID=1848648 RepID=UPI0030B1D0E4